jgi:hypothetical protein
MSTHGNIVLIVIDDLRYEHFSYSGFKHNTILNLDQIRDALYFHNASRRFALDSSFSYGNVYGTLLHTTCCS